LQNNYIKIKSELNDMNIYNNELKVAIENLESSNQTYIKELDELKDEHSQCTIKINSSTTEKEQ
jgi:hypothetical protein